MIFALYFNSAFACVLSENLPIRLANENLLVSINFDQKPLITGKLHTLEVKACNLNKQPFVGKIKADAIMPAHNHGMNYQPSFTMTAPGKFTGTGFVFHMPGLWRLRLTLQSNSGKHLIEHDFVL